VSLYFTLVGGDGGGKIAASTAELISPAGFVGGSFLQENKNTIITKKGVLILQNSIKSYFQVHCG
jgi:hypothetical protein